jgi:hypothetical protein
MLGLPMNNNNGKAEIDQEILKLHKESEQQKDDI